MVGREARASGTASLVVMAKVGNTQWWPACVLPAASASDRKRSSGRRVQLFGSKDCVWLHQDCIRAYDSSAGASGKRSRSLEAAYKEAERYLARHRAASDDGDGSDDETATAPPASKRAATKRRALTPPPADEDDPSPAKPRERSRGDSSASGGSTGSGEREPPAPQPISGAGAFLKNLPSRLAWGRHVDWRAAVLAPRTREAPTLLPLYSTAPPPHQTIANDDTYHPRAPTRQQPPEEAVAPAPAAPTSDVDVHAKASKTAARGKARARGGGDAATA